MSGKTNHQWGSFMRIPTDETTIDHSCCATNRPVIAASGPLRHSSTFDSLQLLVYEDLKHRIEMVSSICWFSITGSVQRKEAVKLASDHLPPGMRIPGSFGQFASFQSCLSLRGGCIGRLGSEIQLCVSGMHDAPISQ